MNTRRKLLSALLVAVTVSWTPRSQAGGPVLAVIVNRSNPATSLRLEDLRPIFQTKRSAWSTGEQLIPLNLVGSSPLRIDFDQAVLGLDAEGVARYWIDRRVRGGARPPARVPNPAIMLKSVAGTAGAIGYVPLGDVNSSVKVVAKISDGKVSAP
jgi:ABC-type phosphate transport system substrate-binding protein